MGKNFPKYVLLFSDLALLVIAFRIVYWLRNALQPFFAIMEKPTSADFGKDVIPRLIPEVWGLPLDGYLIDVGTPENYRKALEEWPAVIRQPRAGYRHGAPKSPSVEAK